MHDVNHVANYTCVWCLACIHHAQEARLCSPIEAAHAEGTFMQIPMIKAGACLKRAFASLPCGFCTKDPLSKDFGYCVSLEDGHSLHGKHEAV